MKKTKKSIYVYEVPAPKTVVRITAKRDGGIIRKDPGEYKVENPIKVVKEDQIEESLDNTQNMPVEEEKAEEADIDIENQEPTLEAI